MAKNNNTAKAVGVNTAQKENAPTENGKGASKLSRHFSKSALQRAWQASRRTLVEFVITPICITAVYWALVFLIAEMLKGGAV